MLKEGDKVPDILGIDEEGRELRISNFAGKKVILYFYPKDNTPGCTAEACSFRDAYDKLAEAGYSVVGVSADSAESHIRFKAKHELPFPLIADVSKELIEAFGTWGEKRLAGRTYMGILRTTFVIDANGIIERIITKVNTKNSASQILDKE